ncbi:MAG: hypothetical protein Q9195_000374 [Heterodermia aff. obscurata]
MAVLKSGGCSNEAHPVLLRAVESIINRSQDILLAGSLILPTSSTANLYTESSHLGHPTQLTDDWEEEEREGMPGAILPGRPGNLTPDQQVKLQELWTASLRVFGFAAPSNGVNGVDTLTEADEKSKSSANGSEKQPKKKRVGLFGKKHRSEETENGAMDGFGDSDDKYGQTKEFHSVLANQSPEDLRKAFWSMVKHDHPDGLLLRFLRARKWDVQKALIMMVATMHWRLQEMHVDDDIITRGEGGALSDSASSNVAVKKEGADFMAQMKLGKSFLHGTDKEGRPMCFVRARLHKQGEQSIWSIIKGWLDPVVASKVHFTKNVEELEAFVERSHIIKELGGDDPYTYEYIQPRPGENDRMSDTSTKERLLDERAAIVKDFEQVTLEWIKEPQAAEQRRGELAERLRSGYWQLDPYIRARSLYDRTGVIGNGGQIQHYDPPKLGVTTTVSAPNGSIPPQHSQDDID